jgi:hypothetical protein
MIISMFGASMSFLGGTTSEQSVRAGVFMFFFILFYSLGQGPGKCRLVYLKLMLLTNLSGVRVLVRSVPSFQQGSRYELGCLC